MRSFVAIPVTPTGQMRKVHSELAVLRKQGLKPVEPENMHLTLKFLGEIDEGMVPEAIAALESAVADHGPFEVVFRGMGAFPNERYIKVVWIGIVSDELISLADSVDRSLGDLGFGRTGFSPHLTLCRVKGPRPKDRILEVLEENRERGFGHQHVESIYLMKSTLTPSGPVYGEVARLELD